MSNNSSSNLLGFYTNRPSSIEQLEEPNLIYKNVVEETNKDILKLYTGYDSGSKGVNNSHALVQLIKMSDVKNINVEIDYIRVCSQHAMERVGILGILTPLNATGPLNMGFTSSLNLDVLIAFNDFTGNEILKCHSHPWDNIDLRIPDGTWQTKGEYTLWSINLVGLFKAYFKYRHKMTVKEFVFKKVLVRALPSILQHSLLNRKGHLCEGIELDKEENYTHTTSVGSWLSHLDHYTSRINGVTIESTIQGFPSIDLGGQLRGLQYPVMYKTSDMLRYLMYGILNRTIAIQRSSNKTMVSINTQYTRGYLRKINLLIKYNKEEQMPFGFIDNLQRRYMIAKELL
jgi:hypothetical protein